jgi:hypothetical protein
MVSKCKADHPTDLGVYIWEDNIKKDPQGRGETFVEWTILVYDRVLCRLLVNVLLKLQVNKRAVIFLTFAIPCIIIRFK